MIMVFVKITEATITMKRKAVTESKNIQQNNNLCETRTIQTVT